VGSSGLLKAVQDEARELAEELPFQTYLGRVEKNPRLARLSHQLVHDMIQAAGVSEDGGQPSYGLFGDELFGVDDAIAQVAEYFGAAARRLDVRKRILVLVGPPGCGKSTLVNTLKQGLEDYTRTKDGAVYTIKGCPVYEEPLHLIPRHRRAELSVHIEGDLCPYCRWLVRNAHRGDISRVPVQRFTFSAAEGIGVGTYVATDPGSEDLTRLVGEVDLSELRGSSDRTAARQAFRLDGELNAANRGIADLIEILKMDERFLSVLLALSQEQMIKLSGRGVMYADEAIVAHSNLAEYESLVHEPRAAALLDRLVVVRMAYALAIGDEVRIYRKLLGPTLEEGRLSPLALRVAATFAVLTRLTPTSGWSLQRKLRYYDGRFLRDVRADDVDSLRTASPPDGSFGFSPRYVLNQLSRALARTEGCLGGLAVLEMLWEGLSQRAGFTEEDRESATGLFRTARMEYDELVKTAVRQALAPDFAREADAFAKDALGELRGSPGAQIRKVEDALGVGPAARDEFRHGVRSRLELAQERKEPLGSADPSVAEALDKSLLPSWGEAAKTLTSGKPERLDALRSGLVKAGFSAGCADDVIGYASGLAGVGGGERRAGPRRLRWRG
jgi:serine protein kinase